MVNSPSFITGIIIGLIIAFVMILLYKNLNISKFNKSIKQKELRIKKMQVSQVQDINSIHDKLIKTFRINKNDYYAFNIRTINNIFENDLSNFDINFVKEVYPLITKLRSSGVDIGDISPIYLISKEMNEIIKLTKKASGESILEKYYKYKEHWEYEKKQK